MSKTPAEVLAEKKPPKNQSARKTPLMCVCRKVRDNLGLSLRDVQRATGISNAAICHIEAGCDVQLTNAMKLAEFYGMSIEQLWMRKKGK